jgi:hypothetical protein
MPCGSADSARNIPSRRVVDPLAKPLPEPEGWEYITTRRSGVHGRGVFAKRSIPKGSYIMEYKGEKVNKAEGTRRTNAQWAKGRIYVFQLNKRADIDGAPAWNLARLANYSCDPNAESQNEKGKHVWIVATRNIRKGDEITYDYNLDFDTPPPECRCGSRKCIGYIVGAHDKRKLRAWLKQEGKPIPRTLLPKQRKKPKKHVA